MTPRPCFWRNALAVSAIGSLVGASPAFAANVTTTTTPSPIVSSTTAVSSTTGVPTPKVILGGGRLLREFSGDALMIDDNYVVVVASPTEHMASIYVESTLKCTGAHSSFRAFFEVKDMKPGKVARVGFVVGAGYFNPHHGPEDLRDNAKTIRTLGNYLDPTFTGDELATIPPLFAV